MGGAATFSGTTFQEDVIVYIEAHLLAQARLGWLAPSDDTPVAVACETKGGGDDIRIEFGRRATAAEVQAKHGITAGAVLADAVRGIADRLAAPGVPNDQAVILVVDRGASARVHRDFAKDLARIRGGRVDDLKAVTTTVIQSIPNAIAVLKRLHVVPIDVEEAHSADLKQALELLRGVLEDPNQATAAWTLLSDDAGRLCARKERRTRKELVDILTGGGVAVRPPGRDDRWHRQLDSARRLLQTDRNAAALSLLKQTESDLSGVDVGPEVMYRLGVNTSVALLHAGRAEEAIQYAQKALDIKPDDIRALISVAQGYLAKGDLHTATRLANRALAQDQHSVAASAVLAQIDAAAGRPLSPVPNDVQASEPYREALLQIAANAADWSRALEISGELLAIGDRSPRVLNMRALSFLNAALLPGGPAPQDAAGEAERLATEVLAVVDDEDHPEFHAALVRRAEARRRLGEVAEAEADLAKVRELASDDPNVLLREAEWRRQAGDSQSASQILSHHTVDRNGLLLALRASVRADVGDKAGAIADAVAAVELASESPEPDWVRLQCASAAIEAGDWALAETILDSVRDSGRKELYFALRGRLQVRQGRVEDATRAYETAAAIAAPEQVSAVLMELGAELRQAGRPADAARVFERAGLPSVSDKRTRFYVWSLVEANELVRAEEVLTQLAVGGTLPAWALSSAAELAARREDLTTAAAHLEEIVRHGHATREGRLVLASFLIEAGRAGDATPHLDAAVSSGDSTPQERMRAAHLYARTPAAERSLRLAVDSFRAASQDPQMHRALIELALWNRLPPPTAESVGSDTCARLTGDGDLEYAIFASPPVDPRRNEYLITDPAILPLVGLRVGDAFVRNRGQWNERSYTVAEILHTDVWLVQDAMLHYEDRFPNEPFIWSFSVSPQLTLKELAPIIASSMQRRELVERVHRAYRESTLPIGFVAKIVGASLPEVMLNLSYGADDADQVLIEWGDRVGQEESRRAAMEASTIVITRSALQTAHGHGLLTLLSEHARLLAPHSLLREVEAERRELERLTAEGRLSLVAAGDRLQTREIPPGAAASQLVDIDHQLEWLRTAVSFVFRPLETIGVPGSESEELRNAIGASSADALALARHSGSTLYADDLGLRRFLPPGAPARSFSTSGLLHALGAKGALGASDRDGHLLGLVRARYAFLAPTVELLELAIRDSGALGMSIVRRVFALLAGPMVDLHETAGMVARLLRTIAVSPVRVMSLEQTVDLALDALTLRWPASLAVSAIVNATRELFTLLPSEEQRVVTACRDYLKGVLGTPLRPSG